MRSSGSSNVACVGACLVSILASPAIAQDADTTAKQTIQLEEVVITGSRLRSAEEGATPVTVFDRERIDELGSATIAEILKYLPQQPHMRADGFNTTGAQYAHLRGLGNDFTLVLINGRRTVPGAATIGFNGFDLNAIPLGAVERIEVLSDSASAVYGADAVGGVVNIILKRSLDRPTIDLRYGAAAGGAEERRASWSGGIAGERWRGSVVLDWFDRGSKLRGELDRSSNQDFRRYGGQDQRSTSTNPANITSRTATPLPGLTSRFAAVPLGSSGLGLAPSDLLDGVTHYDSRGRYLSIVPTADGASAGLFVEVDMTAKVSAFAELMYVDRHTEFRASPSSLSNRRVPASNPFNPFGVDVNVNYSLDGLGPRITRTDSELRRGTAGIRGAIGAWDYELSWLKSRETATSALLNNADLTRVDLALAETDSAGALNVFQHGPGGSPELLESLKSTRVDRFVSEGTLASGFLRGTLLSMPAGDLEVVVGGEWHQASMYERDAVFVVADRTAWSAFTEIKLPLIGREMGVPGIQALSVTTAARYDSYDDFGNTTNPQFGLVWEPFEGVLVRASKGTAFRPPSLFELHAPRVRIQRTLADPQRDNELADFVVIAGGNPNLEPIEATSWSSGILVAPQAWSGLKIGAHYWRIELDGRVGTFDPNLLLKYESRFQDRVRRAPPSPADIAVGLPGPISELDISRINYGRLNTSGVDFELTHSLSTRLGRFSPFVSATWVERYESVDAPDVPSVNRVNIASSLGTIPRWRVVGTLSWQQGPYEMSTTVRHVPSYADTNTNLLSGLRAGRRVEAQTLVDWQGSLDLGAKSSSESWWRRDLKLTIGVVNVSDEEPPFAEVGLDAGYDPYMSEPRGRFFYLNVKKGL